ncbi:CBS domain-containing protein [Desulfococcaceae bacterium OttesenSCG-928-F15]|nr:CBS domain-containing protein [Desulfococcaceae bacterium OttesenSCG-928-F15]
MEIITCHKNADFDAVASIFAAALIYPSAIPVRPSEMSPNVRAFLSIHKDIFDAHQPRDIDLQEVTRLVVVDTPSWKRLDNQLQKLKSKENLEVHLWDHHPEGDLLAMETRREAVGATVTLFVRELRERKIRLTPMQATLFLLGLYEDTGRLTYTSTRSEDALAAAYLLENQADLNILGYFLRPGYGDRQKEVLLELLKQGNTQRFQVRGHDMAVSGMTIEGYLGNLAVVVGMYREFLNVDAAFGVFTDLDRQHTFVIGRSKTEDMNVGGIMRALGKGGGGHLAAGSVLLETMETDAVVQQIRKLIEEKPPKAIQLSDIMSFPVFTVDGNISMEEALAILEEKGCTGLPVLEDGRLAGVISKRDSRKIRKESQKKSPVKAFMSRDPITINPQTSPREAVQIMIRHDIGRLPVVENGKVIGIVSRTDAMRLFYDLLPD